MSSQTCIFGALLFLRFHRKKYSLKKRNLSVSEWVWEREMARKINWLLRLTQFCSRTESNQRRKKAHRELISILCTWYIRSRCSFSKWDPFQAQLHCQVEFKAVPRSALVHVCVINIRVHKNVFSFSFGWRTCTFFWHYFWIANRYLKLIHLVMARIWVNTVTNMPTYQFPPPHISNGSAFFLLIFWLHFFFDTHTIQHFEFADTHSHPNTRI